MNKRPLKLTLFFTYDYSLKTWKDAGLFKRDMLLYEKLAEKGVETTFITYGAEDEKSLVAGNRAFTVGNKPEWMSSKVYRSLVWLIHAGRLRSCQVIKTHQVQGAIAGVLASKIWRKPLLARCGYLKSVFAQLEGESEEQRRAYEREEQLAFRHARLVCVPSQAEAEYAAGQYGLPLDKFRICPNWIDTELFSPFARSHQKFTIIYLARFVEKKAPLDFLKAIVGIDDIRVIMIGRGPQLDEVKAFVAKHRLPVETLEGMANELLPQYFNQGDLYVLPTHHEGGSPKTLLEAMSCALPVISTDGFGVNEVFSDGVEGKKVKFGDVEGLREAILWMREHPDEAKEMGKRGRQRVIEHYSIEKALERELLILEELTGEKMRA
ncbi:MAG: glycosyltransferase family 4 protein [Anaerolineaceae bacterium]|jgi:glycosyltransferase involved in cell wall biosynthesis